MKIKRLSMFLLAVVLIFACMAGCAPQSPEGHTDAQKAELQRRRDEAEAYMREMVTLKWRSDADIVYDIGGETKYTIVAGRLYQGIPYAYAAGAKAAFLDYAGEPDEKGVYTISGLGGGALKAGSSRARIGNDCSSAVTSAWSRVCTTLKSTRSSMMLEANGVVPVGDFKFEPGIDPETGRITDTLRIVTLNKQQDMYAAYAQLQKADAIFYVGSSNHTRMVVSVDVVYTEDGKIDGSKSTVTTLEQTRTNFLPGKTVTDEATGETMYIIGGVDVKYTFAKLLSGGYVPVTCKAFLDPAALEEVKVADSEKELSKEKLFTGTISSNMYIDSVILTIEDSSGKVVQKAIATTARSLEASPHTQLNFDMQQFLTDHPESIRGGIDLDALPAGSYRCKAVCRMTTEELIPVRDFPFEIG